jgi:hypothetical protein
LLLTTPIRASFSSRFLIQVLVRPVATPEENVAESHMLLENVALRNAQSEN